MNRLPRIAIFITDLTGGGAERNMVNLATGISALGYDVDLVVAARRGVYLNDLDARVRLVDLHAPHVMLATNKLAAYLRRERPTALLSALNQPNVVAVLAGRQAQVGTRIVISIRNTLSVEAKNPHSLQMRLMPLFARRYFPKADGIVTVSEGAADDLATFLGIPRDRIEAIGNPVVTPTLLAHSADQVDHPWFAENAPPVIIGVGRLTYQKNFELLLKGFAIVSKRAEARLMILGEGEDRPKLLALAQRLGIDDKLELPGFVPNPSAYLARARLFVLTSHFEGLPTVLIESLAVGTPVVSTDCPSGPREILKGGQYGTLLQSNDAEELAAAIVAELAKPKEPPPSEAWLPYEQASVTRRYLNALLPANQAAGSQQIA